MPSANSHIILMADVIGSRDLDQSSLMTNFKEIVSDINTDEYKSIYSPLTITLGDEFQGVIKDLTSGLDIVLKIEEKILELASDIKLRYVILEGEIETPINYTNSYGMLGKGLIEARETLNNLKEADRRFYISLHNQRKATALNEILFLLQSTVDAWDVKRDYYLVSEFLKEGDYKKVATVLNKERSLMWKRKKSLKLEQYLSIKNLIKYIGE